VSAIPRIRADCYANGWTISTTYDANGRPIGTIDALGNTTKSFYDLSGQVLSDRDVMGLYH
jgi:YD repeat-containing protein